ncbi:MAG: glycosyltransferase [Alphaproteobacteria bacterium]|nr:glycosyltransferase [Alphaproteobacteria bacterium]
MRFLSASGMFAPFFGGGAEFSSFNLAKWLLKQGHDVGVLTTAPTPNDVLNGELYEGLRMWRIYMPRPYTIHEKGKSWVKPLWHLQDHLDPANQRIAASILDAFKPDFVNMHILQGLGHNLIKEIAKRDIPALYFQHDLGLVCIKRSMFVNGKDCPNQCHLCKLSCRYQEALLRKIPRLTLCSPSQANLNKISRYFPLSDFHNKATLNANSYPPPTLDRVKSDIPRLLYVGRLHHTKGIDILLKVCQKIAENHVFHLTVVGGGPDESNLRNSCANFSWCTIIGSVPQQEVSNHMSNCDLLLIPSLWAENSPGVVIHALTLGVPVLGSNKGGIPELVEHDRNGLLIAAGDEAAWESALRLVLEKPENLARWRKYALENAHRFSQDNLAKAIYAIIEETMARAVVNKR